MAKMTVVSVLCGLSLIVAVVSEVTSPDIYCSGSSMDIRVSKEGIEKVTLQKWSSMPGCETVLEKDAFFISLKLGNDIRCGVTKIWNKLTDEVIYYHNLLVTERGGRQHLFKISCFVSPQSDFKSNIVKRSVFPPEFVEPDYIEIIREISGRAPVPELSVGVRQGDRLIGDQVTVTPGAPLSMEVYLDTKSSPTYGILVSYMMVTDTTDKNETIIFNGCTQDRYVFENFETNNGDLLTAKFRAFKFPESNYLMFKGTVDVCLDKCQGIKCSSGEMGYGRKKRALPQNQADPNKIFEVTMMTFLKFDFHNDDVAAGSPFNFEGQRIPAIPFIEEEIYVEQELPSDDSHFVYYGLLENSSAHQTPHFFAILLLSIFLLRISIFV